MAPDGHLNGDLDHAEESGRPASKALLAASDRNRLETNIHYTGSGHRIGWGLGSAHWSLAGFAGGAQSLAAILYDDLLSVD